MKAYPSWVSIEPRLLPLAQRNGFGLLDDWRENVLKKIFGSSVTFASTENEVADLAKVVLELTELDPEMYALVTRDLHTRSSRNTI